MILFPSSFTLVVTLHLLPKQETLYRSIQQHCRAWFGALCSATKNITSSHHLSRSSAFPIGTIHQSSFAISTSLTLRSLLFSQDAHKYIRQRILGNYQRAFSHCLLWAKGGWLGRFDALDPPQYFSLPIHHLYSCS